ncbi:hypothetical protein AiwAL_12525 [Acidiphilium sp. AL]|nr:hypothetical protein [Acidiphilium sp. AL]
MATVETPECAGGKQADQQNARAGGDNLIGGMQIEIADANKEQIGQDKVRKSPKDIDG